MFFDKLFDYRGHEDDLPKDDPLVIHGQDASAMFSHLVDVLRSPETFPNPHINSLMTLTWRLVGNNIVKFAYTTDPNLRTIHYYYERKGSNIIAAFMVPADFAKQCLSRRLFMMGGMVFNSSTMRDLWNDRHTDASDGTLKQRAMAYEAEFYLTMSKREKFVPDDYQKKVMADHPLGLTDKYKYRGKIYMGAS